VTASSGPQAPSPRTGLEERDHGISYTELSYMLMQSYDFSTCSDHGCTIQMCGSDQWGNILFGKRLARQRLRFRVFARG
jgi:tyrosyl-tRNA synthetase